MRHPDDPDRVLACPECDSPQIDARKCAKLPTYRCEDCASTFDEPTDRPRRSDHNLGGPAPHLLRMDADDLPLRSDRND